MTILQSNIKKMRAKYGLTQEEFARRIQENRSIVGAWEEGRSEPSYLTLIKICDAFPKYSDLRKMIIIDLDEWNVLKSTDEFTVQQEVNNWCEETFGPVISNLSVGVRANEEMSELLTCLNSDDYDAKAIEESADIVICLYRLVARMGGDLDQTVRIKMKINKARKWKLNGKGHGQHV